MTRPLEWLGHRFIAATIPPKSKRARFLRTTLRGYIDLVGEENLTPLAFSYLKSAAIVQWELDQVEAQPELNRKEHRVLTSQRDKLFRMVNLVTMNHHSVKLPGAVAADTPPPDPLAEYLATKDYGAPPNPEDYEEDSDVQTKEVDGTETTGKAETQTDAAETEEDHFG